MLDKAILHEVVQRYGARRQTLKLCEEMAELSQALLKQFDEELDRDSVVEELVDVEILIDQMRIIFEVDPDEEELYRDRKLRRLMLRMGS